MALIDIARQKAEEILEGNFTPRGLLASCDWYKEVFPRDSAISFLGAGLLGKKKFFNALKTTILTLAKPQTESGMIPACVPAATGIGTFGSVDAMVWFIVLGYLHYVYTGDKKFLEKLYPQLVLAVRCLQANGRAPNDCVWSQESDDWNDHWGSHGQTLFVNSVWQAVLRYMAVLAGELNKRADRKAFLENYRQVKQRIQDVLWVPEGLSKITQPSTHTHHGMEQVLNFAKTRGGMRHYLAFVSRGPIGNYCDVISNAMAICFGLAGKYETGRILEYFKDAGVAEPYPAAVIYPPVQEGSEHWRDYYYGFNLNLPHHYHNGGAWPHCGGFYVAAHAKAGQMAEAQRQLEKLAEFNKLGRDGEWQFVEWAHGQNGRPWGSRFVSWSAGMYIYAYEVMKNPQILDIIDPKVE